MRLYPVVLPLACASLLACGGENVDGPDPVVSDGGQATDAAKLPDAGEPADAGEPDTGSPDLGFRPGCEQARFRQGALDPSSVGPWPVGVRTVRAAGLDVEVWYPAVPGSESSTVATQYDLRRALPDSEQAKIPDADNPSLPCRCYRDLPLDEEYGPFPVVVFVHGTAGVRAQSVEQVTHWASRGFVVVAADHPGLWLKDVLASACGQGMTERDVEGDVRRLVDAVRTSTGSLAFLGGRIDPDRIGMAGHSAGGGAIENMGDLAQVLAPLAAGGIAPGPMVESVVIMGGTSDRVVPPRRQIEGFGTSPSAKRLIIMDNAGHLAFSAFCALENQAGQNIVQVAEASGVCGTALAGFLFDCNPSYLADEEAWTIVNHATTAAFEAKLQCRDGAEAELSATGERFDPVSDYRESL